jgi:cell shape-determining protein MreC|tara:strand:+ start:253 stop:492 length:240 start_codon:yes stop_codon:yes gene_type:complete
MADTFIKNNLSVVISFIAAVFAAGSIFSEFTALKDELHLVHERLDEKVLIMEKIENRLMELEKKTEYERGLLDATNKIK